MARTRRERIVTASCAVLAVLVIGVLILSWQAREGVEEANHEEEPAVLRFQRLQEQLLRDMVKATDIDSLRAEHKRRGGTQEDLDEFRAKLNKRLDAYRKSKEFRQVQERIQDLMSHEELRALWLSRFKDQPLKLLEIQERKVR
jgi:hypothetical protein